MSGSTTTTPTPPTFSFLSWLRQGSTQAGIQAIGLSVLGYFSGTTSLAVLIIGLVVGLAGLVWPENGDVVAEIKTLATDALNAVAAAKPSLGAKLGIPTMSVSGTASTVSGSGAAKLGVVLFLIGFGAVFSVAACTQQQVRQNEPLAVSVADGALAAWKQQHPGDMRAVAAQKVLDGLNAVYLAEQAAAPGDESKTIAALITAVQQVQKDVPASPVVTQACNSAVTALRALQANTSAPAKAQVLTAVTAVVSSYLASQL